MLARLGLAKGDVVAFLCSNRAEMPEIYFALAKCGIVGIPLSDHLQRSADHGSDAAGVGSTAGN
jgi:acyl-CoA synthetase (AMP-forming)/AMP-acid ligase II